MNNGNPADRPTPGARWARRAVFIVAIGLVIGLGISTLYRAAFGPKERTDFTVYQLAGRAVLDGTDLYQVRNSRGWYYVYPPPFAIAMVPLALMSVFWGALTWYLLSVGLMVGAIGLSVALVRLEQPPPKNWFLLSMVPMGLILGWFISGVTRGQASILMPWLVVAAFYWHRKGRDILGGVCLTGAVLMKVFPVLLLGYFVWRGRWRFVAAALAALLVGTLVLPALVFGWQKNLTYLREWVAVVANPAVRSGETSGKQDLYEQLLDLQKPRNQSLAGSISRLTGGRHAREIAALVTLAMAVVTVIAARRAPADRELLVVAATIVWMLLAPPISESHYFVLLLLPLTVLAARAETDRDARSRWWAGLALAAFGVVSLASISIKSLELYGLLCWVTVVLWAVLVAAVARCNKICQGDASGSCDDQQPRS